MKRCCECGELKALGDFSPDRRAKDGRVSACKQCTCARVKKYYAENREERKAKANAHYHANRDRILAQQRAYNERVKQRRSAKEKARRAEQRAARGAERARTAPERRRRRLQYCLAHYYANRNKHAERQRKWRQENPGLNAEKERRRRARKRSRVGDLNAVKAFYTFVRDARRLRCYWCHKWVPKADRQVDHIIPLVRGGEHAAANLCCACSHCNISKGAKLPDQVTGQVELVLTEAH